MSHLIKDANGTNVSFKSTADGLDLVPHVKIDALPSGLATEAKQDSSLTLLINILNKLISAPATEAKQDSTITVLSQILAKIISAPATEIKQDNTITTLTSILNKIIATPATEGKQDTSIAQLTAILNKIITAPATEAKQDTGNTSLASLAALIRAEDSVSIGGENGFPLLGVRRDEDTSPVSANGDWHKILFDELGRLKVSAYGASLLPVSGSITANGQTVQMNVSRVDNVTISMIATGLSGHNVSFEFSNDSTNGTNGTWYGTQAVRTNANTIEPNSGVLAATPAYAWKISVSGCNWVRVRATAHTAGTAAYIIQPGAYGIEPIPAAQISGTQPVSGTVTVASTTANIGTSGVSQFNDSSTNLAISATFTGTSRDGGATPAFARFVARAFADQAGTLRVEQSTDNTTWRRASADIALAANAVVEVNLMTVTRYYRVIFVNGGIAQTIFQLTSAYFRI